jgi:hypothetical protein
MIFVRARLFTVRTKGSRAENLQSSGVLTPAAASTARDGATQSSPPIDGKFALRDPWSRATAEIQRLLRVEFLGPFT